jgi:hypothetical protein
MARHAELMEAHSLQMIGGNGRSSVIRKIEADEIFLSRRVCKIWTSDCSHSHSWPSVRMEQLCFHLAGFNEMWYFSIFWHVKEIQASLKYYNNNGYFTRRSVSLYDIWLNLLKMRNVSDKSCRASPNTFCVRDVVFFNAYRLPFVTCFVCNDPKIKYMYSSNHTQQYRK